MRLAFAQTLADLARADPRIMLLTADLGFASFDAFIDEFPDRFLNVGVAEQNMLGVATGLALEGHVVFAYSIGPFPTLRCLEQLRNGPCYHNLPVIVVASGAGFAYGNLGYTHHMVEELGTLRCLPNLAIATPATRGEAGALTRWLAERGGPAYMRIDRATDASGRALVCTPGQATLARTGTDFTLATYGAVLSEAFEAAEALQAQGISARQTRGLLVLEEHHVEGGLGVAAAALLLEAGAAPQRFARLGLRLPPSATVGDQAWLRRLNGINAATVISTIAQWALA
jgi:transketolase